MYATVLTVQHNRSSLLSTNCSRLNWAELRMRSAGLYTLYSGLSANFKLYPRVPTLHALPLQPPPPPGQSSQSTHILSFGTSVYESLRSEFIITVWFHKTLSYESYTLNVNSILIQKRDLNFWIICLISRDQELQSSTFADQRILIYLIGELIIIIINA